MKSLSLIVALGAAGCAATVSSSGYVIDAPLLVNGAEVARTTLNYGPTGTCTDTNPMFTDPANAQVKYSLLERACDNGADGVVDYRSTTRVGRGETLPSQEVLTLSRTPYVDQGAVKTRAGTCLVLEYELQGDQRVTTRNQVVDCGTLQPVPAPQATAQPAAARP